MASKNRSLPTPATQHDFTFIDLFAGIGGFRLGLESLGGECVFTCERDRFAARTYESWFGRAPDARDINEFLATPGAAESITDHDILAGGFPCQPFSLAGVSKKASLGRAHGFDDENQGQLFFRILEIIDAKRPPIIFLENVKNLRSHDRGTTWKVIERELRCRDYEVRAEVVDAKGWVPQHRERVFIVGFNLDYFDAPIGFEFPAPPPQRVWDQSLGSLLEPSSSVPEKYTLTENLWKYLRSYKEKHEAKGNGFGFGLPQLDETTRTLSARYHKDGAEILFRQRDNTPRRLTPREAARLMGFPDSLPIVVSDTQAYRQFGNAVSPLVVQSIGANIFAAAGWSVAGPTAA